MQTLTIEIEAITIQPKETIKIYNIYNPSPTSYNSKEPRIIITLRKVLKTAVIKINHVIVRDFNLYHPL
jgi:hypothetical protein